MNRANGIAASTLVLSTPRATILALLSSLMLAACGGGAETADNPQAPPIENTAGAPYSGPAPRDEDVQNFKVEFWEKTRSTDRCGSCHNESFGQTPMFVRSDDVNLAYDQAVTKIDREQPSLSGFVSKVSAPPLGHNCWVDDPQTCGSIVTNWIENWVGPPQGGGRQIVLLPPDSTDPTSSRNFPTDPGLFAQLVHEPLLREYCSDCHSSESANAQQPYFADPDINVAYEAAKSKINLDAPEASQFVVKISPEPIGESHNCWDNNCTTSAAGMLGDADPPSAITAFAESIVPTTVNEELVYSKAVRLVDGTPASGGNRYEDAQIALWEFKTGAGLIAYDTSGVDPAIDLTFSGDVSWYGGWGISIGYSEAQGAGKARGSTTSSRKLFDILQEAGEFSIEAWLVPANVTQEMSQIVSYSSSKTDRNFALQQTLYNYDFLLLTDARDSNDAPLFEPDGEPALSTPDMDEVLQATLQHVVATYSPVDGRKIFVNGNLVSDTDPIPGGTFIDWRDNMAFMLGNEASGDGVWEGTFRLAAIHRRAITPQQITQNFDAGVGEKFYLMFDISERIEAAEQSSYILFEAQQFDSYAYLFDKPHFVTLDGSKPSGIPVRGVRLAMNGQEAPVGQTYATLNGFLDLDAPEVGELGQPLSSLGAVIPLEKGAEDDQFFLTFDTLGGLSYDRPEDPMLVITPTNVVPGEGAPRIGVRTFDEIDASYAAITGVNRATYERTTPARPDGYFPVDETFQELRQSLPAVADIDTLLSAHQVAIAQLAIQYCDAAIGTNSSPNPDAALIWPGFDFNQASSQAFSVANRSTFVDPLIARATGQTPTGPEIATQPGYAEIYEELASFQAANGRPDNLTDRLLAGASDTRAIAKSVCAAVLGSAATLVQ